jgi:hypothetical protein
MGSALGIGLKTFKQDGLLPPLHSVGEAGFDRANYRKEL